MRRIWHGLSYNARALVYLVTATLTVTYLINAWPAVGAYVVYGCYLWGFGGLCTWLADQLARVLDPPMLSREQGIPSGAA